MKTNKLKSAAAFAAALALLLSPLAALTGCAPLIEEDAALAIAKEKIEASVEVNALYFGAGLPYTGNFEQTMSWRQAESPDAEVLPYMPVSPDAPYQTVAELSALAEAVYSADYADYMKKLAFEGFTSGDDVIYPKYVTEDDGTLSVWVGDAIAGGVRTFDLDAVAVTGITPRAFYVTVPSFLDGKPDETLTLTFVLDRQNRKDPGVWKLDTPTY